MNALQVQFMAESRELLEGIGEAMLQLEKNAHDSELLNQLFRQVHTLKGNCGLFDELRVVGKVLHVSEDALDKLREGELSFTPEFADRILDALDFVSSSLEGWESGDFRPEQLMGKAQQLQESISNLISGAPAAANEPPVGDLVVKSEPSPHAESSLPGWVQQHISHAPHTTKDVSWVCYEPEADCFFKGEDPMQLVHSMGEIIYCYAEPRSQWPALEAFDPYNCDIRFIIASTAPENDVQRVFEYVAEQAKITVVPGALCGEEQVEEIISHSPSGLMPLSETSRIQAHKLWQVQKRVLSLSANSPQWLGVARSVCQSITQTCNAIERDAWAQAAHEALIASENEGSPQTFIAWLDNIPSELLAEPVHHTHDAISHISPNIEKTLAKKPADASTSAASSSPATSGSTVNATLSANMGQSPQAPSVEGEAKQNLTLKVPREKIDRLMELIGEMVVAKNALPYLAERAEVQFGVRELSRDIKSHYSVINRIAEEMQDAIMQVRMLPIGSAFQKFPRLVRDLSKKLGKQIKLEIKGEETEADKNIIDALSEPLIHLVRNSLDHGIEPPEDRQAAGKPLEGKLDISAWQEGDRVFIRIADDGAGLNAEKLKTKAVQKGLITEEKARSLTDQEAHQLIFLPGFSTAAVISDVSGRGVGMDVVRSAIAKVNGEIILNSTLGKGTHIDLSLPLTMAVTNVMVIESGGQQFGVPMDIVSETVRVASSDIHEIQQHKATVLRGKIVPLMALNGLLGLGAEHVSNEVGEYAVLVIRFNGESIGIVVDDFDSTVDIILRPLEGMLGELTAYSGSALLGDGSILLVLNLKDILACR